MTKDNINIDSVEVEFDGSIEDGRNEEVSSTIEQLPHDEPSVDDDHMNNLPTSRHGHASKRYITFAILGGTAVAGAFYGSGFGIGKAANNSINDASSVSSASNLVVRTNSVRSSKSDKGKSGKCSKITVKNSKSAKSTRILPADTEPSVALVTLPVELKDDCECIIENVAITVGIDYPDSRDLYLDLESESGKKERLFFFGRAQKATFVSENKVTFDDADYDPSGDNIFVGDPDSIADGIILAGTYNSDGNPGLPGFKGERSDLGEVEGDWTFGVENEGVFTGAIESVQLDITCESE